MKTIKKGTSSSATTTLLQSLLREAGYDVTVDGSFGVGTERAVMDYQRRNGLVADGVVGAKTWMTFSHQFPQFFAQLSDRFLSEQDLVAAARDLDVELAAIKAVTEVESRGTGFLGDLPRILFEGHVFWRRLKAWGVDPRDHEAGNEDVLYRKWTKTHYLGGVREFERLEKAERIHRDAALESASWGMFQIMGEHWKALGYPSATRFVELMRRSEAEHLKAFARFVRVNRLDGALRDRNWTRFARGYNGPGFAENRYDEKLARAYARFAAAAADRTLVPRLPPVRAGTKRRIRRR